MDHSESVCRAKLRMQSISLLLGLCLLLALLTACAPSAEKTTDADTAAASSDAAVTEGAYGNERANYKDTLPDGLDFKGQNVTFLVRNDEKLYIEEISVEALNGEVLNDALYNRNTSVEERLNVKIGYNDVASDSYNSTVSKSVNAGDCDFDITAGYAYYITPLAATGNFLNWMNVDYIDFNMPWWDDSLLNELVIDGKLHFISGDASLALVKNIWCELFNKKVADDYGLGDFYDMVVAGTWTLDEYITACHTVYTDLNGNGECDEQDCYGVASVSFDYFFPALDIPITTMNGDGLPELTLYGDKLVTSYNKLYELMTSGACYSMKAIVADRTIEGTMFKEDRLLMIPSVLWEVEQYRNMNTDFGVLPIPKYDEAQENYITIPHDCYSLFSIPVTAAETDYIGATLEAMAAESYRTVTPAYLEVALKEKYTRDIQSQQILDIIFEHISFNFGIVYSNSLQDVGHFYRNIFNYVENPVSAYEKEQSSYEKALAGLIGKYKALNN